MNVTLLDEAGRTMTLRRVHEGTGEWLTGKGEMEKPRSAYLNMDVPKVFVGPEKATQKADGGNRREPTSVQLSTSQGFRQANP